MTVVGAAGTTFTVADIAERVARDYLGLRPGERFAIIVDDRTDPEIPRELARAAARPGRGPGRGVVPAAGTERRGTAGLGRRRDGRRRRRPVRRQHVPVPHDGQGGGAASGRPGRLQRPVPRRCLAGQAR